MSKIFTCLLFVVWVLRLTAAGAGVAVGMTEDDLLAAKGEPQASLFAGDKTIYRWPDMVVFLEHAKVVSIDLRDLQREQAEQERRAKMLAEIARKAEIARQQELAEDKKRAEEEERLRPQRELAELKAKVEKLEKDRAEEAAAQQQRIISLEQQRRNQILALSQTIDTTGFYYRKAKAEGDVKKAEQLLRLLNSQQLELSALTGPPVH